MAVEAQDSVVFVDAARRKAKDDVGLAWLALALYSVFAVSAVALGAGATQGKFLWIVAAPFVVFAAFVWAFFDGRERGVEASRLTLIAIPFGLLTIAYAIGVLGWSARIPLLMDFGPSFVVAVGYIAIGVQRRQRVLVIVGVVGSVVATALALVKGGDEFSQAILALAYVTTLLFARAGWRLTHVRRS
jgi:hypothetical protein